MHRIIAVITDQYPFIRHIKRLGITVSCESLIHLYYIMVAAIAKFAQDLGWFFSANVFG